MFKISWVQIPGAIYWMYIWKFFHIDLLQNCIVCLKGPKINGKESRVGPFFKNKDLTQIFCCEKLRFKTCPVSGYFLIMLL